MPASFDGVSFERTSPEQGMSILLSSLFHSILLCHKPNFHFPAGPSAMATAPRDPAQSPTPAQVPEAAKAGASSSPLQSPPAHQSPSPNTNQPTTQPAGASASATTGPRTRETLTVRFADVAAHTAKCDECDKRNRDGMSRCLACGWQCCRMCLSARAGDRTHRSFTSIHAPENGRNNDTPRPDTGGGGTAAGDSRPSTSGQEAAETLLGISGENTPTGRGSSRHGMSLDGRGGMDREGSEGLALTTDDDETLTWLSKSEDENGGLSESALEDMGLVRRNPPRASRPFGMAE